MQDIFKNERKGKYAAERKIAIEEERTQLKKTIQKEDNMISALESLIADIKTLTDQSNLDNETAYYTLGKLKVNPFSLIKVMTDSRQRFIEFGFFYLCRV